MSKILVEDLKMYLDKCPDEAEVILGVKEYESPLADILKSPISNDKVRLVDQIYLEDCKII